MTESQSSPSERFKADTAEHTMTVLRDDGLYRHLRFQKPGTYCMGFDIVTWPGHLAYSGDMGCYVFTRVADMFEFFRRESPNPSYWSEKCVAIDRDGIDRFDADLFREAINRRLDEAEQDDRLPPGAREAVIDEVLSSVDDGEHEAMRAAIYFEHEGFRFDDFWETRCREYTFLFLWCCNALPWAIRQYDSAKETANV